MVVVLLTALGIGRAAAQSEPARDGASDARSEELEEVTVIGRQTTRALRLEVQAAKEKIYDLFNSLNSDGEFDIHCRDSAATGTRITQRVCRPQFTDNATGRAADRMLRSVLFQCPPINNPAWLQCFNRMISVAQGETAQVPLKEQQLAAEMQRVARESPEFRRAIAEYQAAEHRYQDARRAEGPASRVSVAIIDTVAATRSTRARRQGGIVAPRPVDLATPDAFAAREGWVKLRYSVRVDGAATDVRLVDAMPPDVDPSSAIAAASAWRFEPATTDGMPIDWHNNLAIVVFSGGGVAHEGWLDLADAYEDVAALIADARLEDAKSHNERMRRELALSLEEVALAEMQLAAIEHALGNSHAALAAIRRATEPAVQALADDELALALEHRFALEVELGRAPDALETFERRAALARVSSRDPLARQAAALRSAIETPYTSLLVQARIDAKGQWEHALTWRTFAIGGVDGRNDGLEVECHRRKAQLPFQADVEMTIPDAWGECVVLVTGRPGTTFTLHEFAEPLEE